MAKRTMTCIQCPLSCRLTVNTENSNLEVWGNQCRKGEEYARHEIFNPTRSLTSTVATIFADFPLLPVRTAGEVPKGRIFEIMEIINSILVEKRLRPGDVILETIPGTSTPLIATADMCEMEV